jgi:hypothetical protein
MSPQPLVSTPADRLETAIEETTTGMGALVTQLIRHSLYNGVHTLQGHLQEMADERVAVAVAARLPAIERSAEEAAHRVAREQVVALEGKTEAMNRALAGQIDEVEQRARAAAAEVRERAVRLSERIEETSQQAHSAVTAVRTDLSAELTQVETRVQESASDLVGREIDALRQRARASAVRLRKEQAALRVKAEILGEQLRQEKEARSAEVQAVARSVLERLQGAEERGRQAEQQARGALAEVRKQLSGELDALRKENKALQERIAELEKPRGLKALWQRMFTREG